MTRKVTLVLGVAALVLLTGLWLGVRSFTGEPSRPGPREAARGESVEDLMMDLLVIPLDPRPAKAFSLETVDGKRLALADLAGRPVLLYFWASW
jgi:cytochrome oxidase Cu insertion factor (SCO1/SenC/PrrC family)